MRPAILKVVGVYRGRTYTARLTPEGMWVVTCDGPVFVLPAVCGAPADSVRTEIERLFRMLPERSRPA